MAKERFHTGWAPVIPHLARGKKEVADLVRQDLERVNGYLPEQSRVQKFVLLHKEFDPDEAELTRTRKLRREFMEERYKELIDALYGEKDKVDVQAAVT